LTDPANLRLAALQIFEKALRSVDAGEAVRRAVNLGGTRLAVVDSKIDLFEHDAKVYAIALGKAAPAMAAALDHVLGNTIAAGVISGPSPERSQSTDVRFRLSARWQSFAGGHPIPNQESMNGAQAAFELLKRANHERALVIFLISGGGSAMLEWPIDEEITLADLAQANRLLVACGASIAEINSVRRALSAVKGGGLADRAPSAAQVSLIVSDTNEGDEANVASGPTIQPPADAPDARVVVASYEMLAGLPAPILKAINTSSRREQPQLPLNPLRKRYVLLDNRVALEAAAQAARDYGFLTEIAFDVVENRIEHGCSLLLSRLAALRSKTSRKDAAVCLISGGEFLCPVRGDGNGGRNSETALRCAIEIDQQQSHVNDHGELVMLSAGTDGIDGNSPAAGAIADETTIQRARAENLEARSFLERSDAFTFFHRLGDTMMTGPTGTNVRDIRVLLAR
jgi:glycerate 2-kinase